MAENRFMPFGRIAAGTGISVTTASQQLRIVNTSPGSGGGGSAQITGHATLTYNTATRIGLRYTMIASHGSIRISYLVLNRSSDPADQAEYAEMAQIRMPDGSTISGRSWNGGATSTVEPLRAGSGSFFCSYSVDEPTTGIVYPKIRSRNSDLLEPITTRVHWAVLDALNVIPVKV